MKGEVPFKCPSCDFYCCRACWKQLLKKTGICPACRVDTKMRHLGQVFFLPKEER
ncbi:hypothetical protein FKM82_022390 [Ascaphus truei]